MSTIEKIRNQKGLWLFVAPISGLSLSKDINKEITVNKITFISRDKLAHVRKRLGFPITISELKSKNWTHDFFDSCSVYAVSSIGGKGSDKEREFLDCVQKELYIISLSQLGYGRRKRNANLSVACENRPGLLEYLMMNTTTKSSVMQQKLSGRFRTLKLDKNWKKFQKFCFFYELLNVFKGNISISPGWKSDILNAAYLAGQSQSSSDLPHAFLWNMIAIETLLTQQGDSYSTTLPKRVEAFIGWTTNWSVNNFENKIVEVYKKRCALVHAGKVDSLTVEDLLFTDVILVNIFYNILKHLSIFGKKEDLIEFSRKVEAEHVLGVKPKIRPKSLSFISMRYSDKDYDGI